MRVGPKEFIISPASILLAISLLFALPFALGRKKDSAAERQMDEHKRAAHAISRLTFGSRPGDIERVEAMGVDKWIDEQLHPEKIDDSAMEARLVPFRTLKMDTQQIVENFPPPEIIRAIANGKQFLPSDPVKRVVYEAQLERYQEKQEKKERKQQVAATNTSMTATDHRLTEAWPRLKRMLAACKRQPTRNWPSVTKNDFVIT